MLERWFHAGFRGREPQAVAAIRARLLRCDPGGYVACCHAVAAVDWYERLATLALPTLIIAGAQDAGAPPAMSQAMAAQIAGSKVVVLKEAAHLSVIEQPRAFAQLVREFLS